MSDDRAPTFAGDHEDDPVTPHRAFLEVGGDAASASTVPNGGVSSMLLVTKKAKMLHDPPPPPSIVPLAPSRLLLEVRDFLPRMRAAGEELEKRMEREGGKEAVQVDNVEEGSKYVEMSIGLVPPEREDSDWSADSDPDSPPTPRRDGHDNNYTSDSDSDSTISTSSGSVSSSHSKEAFAKPKDQASSSSEIKMNISSSKVGGDRKRPLIEEIGNCSKDAVDSEKRMKK